MPHKRPNGLEFLACHRMLMDRSVAATASRDHWTPYPESPSKWPYGLEANGEAAFRDRLGDHFELPGHPATMHGLPVLRETVREHGALTAAIHSTSENLPAAAESAALDAGVHLSENRTGGVFVNQSAAFSDFPAGAANPAVGTTLSDPAFVTGRCATLQSRRPVPAEEFTCA